MKKKVLFSIVVVLALALAVFAQTNSGAWRISPGGFFEVSNALLLESTAGSGANVGLLGSSSNSVFVTQNDGATKLGSVPAVVGCGTTTTCAVTSTTGLRAVFGTVTLAANTATITALPFSGTSNFACIATDQTTPQLVKAVPASATTATITDTVGATDVVAYACFGN